MYVDTLSRRKRLSGRWIFVTRTGSTTLTTIISLNLISSNY